MGLADRFNRGGQPAATLPQRAPGKGTYSGIAATQTQLPFPEVGDYDFEIASFENKRRPSDMAEYTYAPLTVLSAESHPGQGEASPVGSTVVYMQFVTPAGISVTRDFLMCAHGYSDIAAFEAWDATVTRDQVENVQGKKISARVTLGKPDGKGGYYRHWQFAPYEAPNEVE